MILDKPYDMTSTQAVGKVRWLFGAKKAGHAGTLDPLATGILPIALGEATKTVPNVQDGEKPPQILQVILSLMFLSRCCFDVDSLIRLSWNCNHR